MLEGAALIILSDPPKQPSDTGTPHPTAHTSQHKGARADGCRAHAPHVGQPHHQMKGTNVPQQSHHCRRAIVEGGPGSW